MSHPEYKNVGDPLDRLIEEASGVIQAAIKIKRFGIDNYHPVTLLNNGKALADEVKDLNDAWEDVVRASHLYRKG